MSQAFDYLSNEYFQLEEILNKKANNIFDFFHFDTAILENNLYGVDINESAVEIAKLSLWLKTAKPERKLTDLNKNIVCANSLLNMPFELNSFDIVIGNPPYVRQELIKDYKEYLKNSYEVFVGTADLYVYFYELAYKMLKQDGLNGFICSNKFFRAKYGEKLRTLILDKMTVLNIADFNGKKVFANATVDSSVTILQKSIASNDSIFKFVDSNLTDFVMLNQKDLDKSSFSFAKSDELNIKKKIESIGIPLKNWDIKINYGIKTGFNEAFIISTEKRNEILDKCTSSEERERTEKIIKKVLRGRDIKRYSYEWADLWIISTFPSLKLNIDDYPSLKEYLLTFGKKLNQSGEIGSRKKTGNEWFETQDQIAYWHEFEKEKIVWKAIGRNLAFSKVSSGILLSAPSSFITSNSNTYILAFLSSSTIQYFIYHNSDTTGAGDIMLNIQSLEKIPIPKPTEKSEKILTDLVDKILNSKNKIAKIKKHFDKLSAIDKIEISEELEKLENIILSAEQEIDREVYKLYGLTRNEIEIVEGKV